MNLKYFLQVILCSDGEIDHIFSLRMELSLMFPVYILNFYRAYFRLLE